MARAPNPTPEKTEAVERTTKVVQLVGGIIAAVIGLFGLAKSTIDLRESSRKDLRAEIDATAKIFSDSAGWASSVKLAKADPVQAELVAASYSHLVNLPTPLFNRDQWMGAFRDQVDVGFLRICGERRLALDMHRAVAAADPVLKTRLDGIQQQLASRATGQDPAASSAILYDKKCWNAGQAAAQEAVVQNQAPAAPAGQAAAPATAAKAPAPSADGVRVNSQAVNVGGWDIDVFACEEHPGQLTAAKQTADYLGKLADARTGLGGQPLGRIRLRTLPAATRRKLNTFAGNQVMAATNEGAIANPLAKAAGEASGLPVLIRPASTPTPWYVSVMFCAPPS